MTEKSFICLYFEILGLFALFLEKKPRGTSLVQNINRAVHRFILMPIASL